MLIGGQSEHSNIKEANAFALHYTVHSSHSITHSKSYNQLSGGSIMHLDSHCLNNSNLTHLQAFNKAAMLGPFHWHSRN